MSQEQHLTGVILSKMSLKETDILFTFLSLEQGKMTIVARGAKKAKSKQGAFIQMGAILQIDIVSSSSDIATLRGVKSVYMPENLSYTDLILFENILKSTKNICKQNHILSAAVHELMCCIPVFCHTSAKFLVSFAYTIKLFTHLGFLGSLRQCPICSQTFVQDEHVFRPFVGIVCKKCSQNSDQKLFFDEFKVLICLQEQKYEVVTKLVLSQAMQNSLAAKFESIFVL